MPDCRVDPAAPSDPKFSMLAELLTIERPHALGLATSIWCLCWRKEYFDGRLKRWTPQALADEIYWKGDAQKLVASLLTAEVLVKDRDGTLVAKNFTERQGPLIKKLLRERGGNAPTMPAPAEPPPPQTDEVVRQLLQQMKLCHIPGGAQQKRDHIEAWRARGITGGTIQEAIMNNPGKSVFELEKLLTKPAAAAGSGLPTTIGELTKWANGGAPSLPAPKAVKK